MGAVIDSGGVTMTKITTIRESDEACLNVIASM